MRTPGYLPFPYRHAILKRWREYDVTNRQGDPEAELNGLKSEGGEVIFILADITEEDQVKCLVHEAETAYLSRIHGS